VTGRRPSRFRHRMVQEHVIRAWPETGDGRDEANEYVWMRGRGCGWGSCGGAGWKAGFNSNSLPLPKDLFLDPEDE